MKDGKKRSFWRAWHKWVGLFFSIFIMLFCFSGIILNHRHFFSSAEVSRQWLPKAYHIENWNQSVVQGTFRMEDGSLLAYGQAGIWKTDSTFSSWTEFNDGIRKGIDNRKISNIVRTSDGNLWCAGLYDAYTLKDGIWSPVILEGNRERISDITTKDGSDLVVLTRSKVYTAKAPDYRFTEITLLRPEGYEQKVTLFKTFWMIHSGEIFGIVGKLIVDAMAVILIILCITGIVFFVLSASVRRQGRKIPAMSPEQASATRENMKKKAGRIKNNLRLHNSLGSSAIILTLILSVTGMCLRPPLMIPLAITKVSPIPGSTLADKNVFHDKLRSIRWDEVEDRWLLSTSEGFYSIGENIENSLPEAISPSPTVSPMGINVFARNPEKPQEWLVGSFSGLFSWNISTGEVTDWFTGEKPERGSYGVTGSHSVTGWTEDLGVKPVVFDYYSAPNADIAEMPEILSRQKMSLWNFALELHVGRCYERFLGSILSVLFVFLSGAILTLVLLSGYILYRKSKRTNKSKN